MNDDLHRILGLTRTITKSQELMKSIVPALEKQNLFMANISQSFWANANILGLQYNSYISKIIENQKIYESSVHTHMVETVEKYRSQLSYLNDISPILSNILHQTKLRDIIQFNYKSLHIAQDNFMKAFGENYSKSIVLPSERILNYIALINVAVDKFKLSEAFAYQAFQVPNAYQVFAKRQYKYALKNDKKAQQVLTITEYAGEMVINSEEALESTLELVHEKERGLAVPYVTPVGVNLFSLLSQHLAYTYRSDLPEDIEINIKGSIPAQVNALGANIFWLIFEINRYFECKNGCSLISPSNRIIYAASKIPNLVCSNEDEFALIVDYLYLTLYEGTGAKDSHLNGILSEEELIPFQMVRNLRNNFRHDMENGKNAVTKFKKMGEVFNNLIGKSFPLTVSDWKKAQVALYFQITKMLVSVLKTLNIN